MKICPHCKSKVSDTAKKCKHCWEIVVEEKVGRQCPYCDAEVSETAKKCRFCWNWINEKEDILDNQSDRKISVKDEEDNGFSKQLIMAIIWGILLIFACITLRIILLGVILLIFWILLVVPYFNDCFGKK